MQEKCKHWQWKRAKPNFDSTVADDLAAESLDNECKQYVIKANITKSTETTAFIYQLRMSTYTAGTERSFEEWNITPKQ